MSSVVKVNMADYKTCLHPCRLITHSLGSCVAVSLYDGKTRITGMAHIMLPTFLRTGESNNKKKYADTAIEEMYHEMIKKGAASASICAKIAGGADMFKTSHAVGLTDIGNRNISASRAKLSELGIIVISEDTGGNYARTIEINTADGKLKIKTIRYGIRVI